MEEGSKGAIKGGQAEQARFARGSGTMYANGDVDQLGFATTRTWWPSRRIRKHRGEVCDRCMHLAGAVSGAAAGGLGAGEGEGDGAGWQHCTSVNIVHQSLV